MATYSSSLAWEILLTEEPGGLQSMGCQEGWTLLDSTPPLSISKKLSFIQFPHSQQVENKLGATSSLDF